MYDLYKAICCIVRRSCKCKGAYILYVFSDCDIIDSSTCGLDQPSTAESNGKPLLHFLCWFLFLFVLPWKPYDETVQNEICDSAERWDSQVGKHSNSYGEEQRTSMNSIVANDPTRSKPEGYLVTDVHKNERKVWHCTTYTIGTWNVRSTIQGKLETVRQEIERLNFVVLSVSELKWTGMGQFQSGNKAFYSENVFYSKYFTLKMVNSEKME